MESPPPQPINCDVASTVHLNSGDSTMTLDQHTSTSTTNPTLVKKKIKHKKKRNDVHKSNIDTSSFNSVSSSSSSPNLLHSVFASAPIVETLEFLTALFWENGTVTKQTRLLYHLECRSLHLLLRC